MKDLDLTTMIGIASDVRPAAVTAALVAVRDRATLTLGEVTVRALLYSAASQVPTYASAAARLASGGDPGALVAACAIAPVAHTADLLRRFLDVVERVTGGVMKEPLQGTAVSILSTAIEAPLPAGLGNPAALGGSLM